MSTPVSKKDHWREVYRQQRLKNGHLWLEEFGKTSNPVMLAATNYDKILQAIEQTLKHEDSFDTGCDLLREVFPIAFGMADWGRWLVYLKGALAMSQQLNNRSNDAYLHEWIADIELSLTHLSEAEKHFRQALKIYLDEGEMVRYGRNLPQLARVYTARGEIPEAMELCLEALRLGQNDGMGIVVAGAHYGLAVNYQRTGEYEEALVHCSKAIAEYDAIGKHNFVFRIKTLEVACKVALGRFDEATVQSDGLVTLFNNSDNAYDNLMAMIYLRNVMGTMAFKIEAYHTAEEHWHEAYQQSLMVGAPDYLASLGNNLGKVYTILDEFEAAKEMFADALERYDQLGDEVRWANCMDNLVDLYEKTGDLAAAETTLRTAIGRLEPAATMLHSQKMLQKMQQRLENSPKS